MNRLTRPKCRTRQRAVFMGFAMFEALIALLICAMGILGVVGLQSSMTRAQTAATFRAEASFLAQQLIGEMWSDVANLGAYNTASCGTRCTAWVTRVAARLPKGQATVVVTAPRNVSIQISWTVPGESTSTYSTVASVGVR